MREAAQIIQATFARYLNMAAGWVAQLEHGVTQTKGLALAVLKLIRCKGIGTLQLHSTVTGDVLYCGVYCDHFYQYHLIYDFIRAGNDLGVTFRHEGAALHVRWHTAG